jgi:hypothetical protein
MSVVTVKAELYTADLVDEFQTNPYYNFVHDGVLTVYKIDPDTGEQVEVVLPPGGWAGLITGPFTPEMFGVR